MSANGEALQCSGNITITSPQHRRHPQLFRQMEQDEVQSPLPASETHPFDEMQSPRKHPPPPPPTAQRSQGSSSSTSGTTAMSIGTSGGGSLSSGKSARGSSKTSGHRGARFSSSASSSTEETEARERRFGSVDLHPLPTMPTNTTGTRRGLMNTPATQRQCQLHFAALLSTLQQQYAAQTSAVVKSKDSSEPGETPACYSSQPSVPTANLNLTHLVNSAEVPSTLSAAALLTTSKAQIADLNRNVEGQLASSHLINRLPQSLWPCLVCPVHSAGLLQSSRLLFQQLEKAKWDPHSANGPSDLSDAVQSFGEASVHVPNDPLDSSGCTTTSSWTGVLGSTVYKPSRVGPYELGPTLGRGNFAVVKLGRHILTKMKVAIKIMNKDLIGSNNLNKVSRELEAMKRCQHPHIVRLYHIMENESNIFMVTEYASRGEVFDHISKSRAFSEKEARELFWQIVCAIDFCHNSGVVHRDLKAENLLLDEELKIKVADFGFCNFFQPDQFLSTHCGSPQYAAPELFKGEPYDGPLADVWSLGVILYILVCGSFPFPGESLGDIRSQVLRGLVRFPFFLSTACEQVIRCMLQVDPTRRLKLRQISNMPWMQASPNVTHYRAMMTKYEDKAKDRHFDEIFRRQYPEHSELARTDQVERAARKLDLGVLRALTIGAGFDEAQVRLSIIQNKCDRFHAAYQLLCAKIRHFSRNSHLCQVVNNAMNPPKSTSRRRNSNLLNWRSPSILTASSSSASTTLCSTSSSSAGTGTGRERSDNISVPRRNVQLPTVPDVLDETMAETGRENIVSDSAPGDSVMSILDVHKSSTELTVESYKKPKEWINPTQPGSIDFNVALFILKADEDAIVSQLGLTTPVSVVPIGHAVRRHTVQLTGPLFTPIRSTTDHTMADLNAAIEDAQAFSAINAAPETKDVNGATLLSDTAQTVTQRTTAHRFPRQTTQPRIRGLGGHQPEQLIRTALDWMPNPWDSSLQRLPGDDQLDEGDSSSKPQKSGRGVIMPHDIPSLELGEEAATTKPPMLNRIRRSLLRRDTMQEFQDDDEVDTKQPTFHKQCSTSVPESFDQPVLFNPAITSLSDLAADTGGFEPAHLTTVAPVPLPDESSWVRNVRDGADFERQPEPDNPSGPTAMETDVADNLTETVIDLSVGNRSCWSNTPSQLKTVENASDSDTAVLGNELGTLLPQLNLPANLPAMIHQPVARFTVKDPHLLAPPEFMTPQSSSFPRRSSDGAAELQPLHRPALAVGGSYPEQTNYRTMHTSSETDTSTLIPPATSSGVPNSDYSETGRKTSDSLSTAAHSVSTTHDGNVDTSNVVTKPDDRFLAIGSVNTQNRLHTSVRSVHPVGVKMDIASSSVIHQSQTVHPSRCSTLRPQSMVAQTWIRPELSETGDDAEEEEAGSNAADSEPQAEPWESQFERHLKRFSLPVAYRPSRLSSDTSCICHQPLTSDVFNQIQQFLIQLSTDGTPLSAQQPPRSTGISWMEKSLDSGYLRRGSEASQMLAWKRRLNQCGDISDPDPGDPLAPSLLCAQVGSVDRSTLDHHLGGPLRTNGTLNTMSSQFTSATETGHNNNDSNSYSLQLGCTDPSLTYPSGSATVVSADSAIRFPAQHPGDWSELCNTQVSVDSAQLVSRVSPTSPSCIELNELKTELYKLETEDQLTVHVHRHSPISLATLNESRHGHLNSPLATSPSTSAEATNAASNPILLFHEADTEFHESPDGHVPVELFADKSHRWSQRRFSLKIPRRASSATAAATSALNRDQSAGSYDVGAESVQLPRRLRYSVGDRLDRTVEEVQNSQLLVVMDSDSPSLSAPLSCHPSSTGLHMHAEQIPHRSITFTLSDPNPAFPLDGFHTPSLARAHVPHTTVTCDRDRTALSSPGASWVMSTVDWSSPHVATRPLPHPASTGVKRRLLGSCGHTKQAHDYLRVVHHTGGSLDRRLNLDFLTSPKRKLYQEWLPRVTAFPHKATTAVFQNINPTNQESTNVNVSGETEGMCASAIVCPTPPPCSTMFQSASMSAKSSTVASSTNMNQDSEDQLEDDVEDDVEDERACDLAPLQSQLTLNYRSRLVGSGVRLLEPASPAFAHLDSACAPHHHPSQLSATYHELPTFSSHHSTSPNFYPDMNPMASNAAAFMFLQPGDDDDDLVEIDRVNQRLAMSGGCLPAFESQFHANQPFIGGSPVYPEPDPSSLLGAHRFQTIYPPEAPSSPGSNH
ncbi:hypothetical protein PHET_03726 [Paragonimus heterotremus]|uniref:non-specific serine/threonine protein kinase n=1 Tax=Paragonimus heterotremus TaxID=100268 RepID=A0A8J4TJN4_9TREM|nr:hypothetical protein PHET_03726 [Paragonimus heterotremus]